MHAPAATVFTWILGHCGILGNENADHLAGPMSVNGTPTASRSWILNDGSNPSSVSTGVTCGTTQE